MSAYARAVVEGEIPACRLLILAAQRHLTDLERAAAGDPAFPYAFDAAEADRRIRFFSKLKQSKGRQWAGKPLELQPWQQFIVGSIYGWKRRADGLRRFRQAFISIPRKNGKSTMAAGLGLNLAFFDGEPGAEVYSAATKRDQAKIVWDEAKRMVERTPALSKRIARLANNLNRSANAQKFEPLGADADTLDGLNPHAVVIDELHAHKTRAVVDVLESATGAREQPIQLEITTAGFDQNTVCFEHHEYSVKVLERIFSDETWFTFIASIDKGDDWRDRAAWIKANPNFGVSVLEDDLERLCRKAEKTPAAQNNFKTKRLNVWVDQAERWLSGETWDECAELAVDVAALAGRPCFAGLDLASTTDVCALELVFPEDDWAALSFFWIPEERMRAAVEEDRVPYDVWRDQGFVFVTPGNVVDYAFIRKTINGLRDTFNIREIGFDPWNATQLVVELETLDSFLMVKVPQTMAGLSAASKELETRLGAKTIRPGRNPVLRWMASNAACDKDANDNRKPSKKKSTKRIDGIVALVMAIDRAMRQPGSRSVYADRGILVL